MERNERIRLWKARFKRVPIIGNLRWKSQREWTNDLDERWQWKCAVPASEPVKEWPGRLPFRSEPCSEYHFYLDHFRYWSGQLRENPRFHRKQWEFVYIAQALQERGLLAEGKRGLGFGVGTEPLVSLFARDGVQVVATDLYPDAATNRGWATTNQHATSLEVLNKRGICDPDIFAQRVELAYVDMNAISADLTDFDFNWSACCLEHLGSISNGLAFIENSLRTLKIGGWAVHTTEYNLSSNFDTLDHMDTVLFRKKDIVGFIERMRGVGHYVEPLLLHSGFSADNFVDLPPYRDEPHLRLRLNEYNSTSIGLILQRRV